MIVNLRELFFPFVSQLKIADFASANRARSGFSFIPTPEGIVLYGGYTKKYEGKKVEGIALNDNWLLKMPPVAEDGTMDFTKFKWEKRKNPGYNPNPTRSGGLIVSTAPDSISFLMMSC